MGPQFSLGISGRGGVSRWFPAELSPEACLKAAAWARITNSMAPATMSITPHTLGRALAARAADCYLRADRGRHVRLGVRRREASPSAWTVECEPRRIADVAYAVLAARRRSASAHTAAAAPTAVTSTNSHHSATGGASSAVRNTKISIRSSNR